MSIRADYTAVIRGMYDQPHHHTNNEFVHSSRHSKLQRAPKRSLPNAIKTDLVTQHRKNANTHTHTQIHKLPKTSRRGRSRRLELMQLHGERLVELHVETYRRRDAATSDSGILLIPMSQKISRM